MSTTSIVRLNALLASALLFCAIPTLVTAENIFAAPRSFAAGNDIRDTRLLDLDGDGALDLVTANSDDDTVSVLMGAGDGGFGEQTAWPAGNSPYAVAGGDFNGDGIVDLAAANYVSDDVTILFGVGDGSFGPPDTVPAGEGPVALRSADLNNDGIADLVTANYWSEDASALLGDGAGGFLEIRTGHLGRSQRSLEITDLDLDGNQDLVAVSGFIDSPYGGFPDGAVFVLKGNGDGTFQERAYFFSPDYYWSVAAGDYNEDGRVDIAVTIPYPFSGGGERLMVASGLGDGTFAEPAYYPTIAYPYAMVSSDLDGDGHLDLVLEGRYELAVHSGAGDGTFTPGPVYVKQQRNWAESLAAGDVNTDRRVDIIQSGYANLDVHLGLGDGCLAGAGSITIGGSPHYGDSGDLDGDGDLDLAVAMSDQDIYICPGNGDGSFADPTVLGSSQYPMDLLLADLDGDGDLDMVVAHADRQLWSFPGNGDGSFSAPLTLDLGCYPEGARVGLLDADGHPDLVVANRNGDEVRVHPGNGDCSFGPPTAYPVGQTPVDITLLDFDLDGHTDLAVANSMSDDLTLLRNDGAGGFLDSGLLDTRHWPIAVIADDLNGDGLPDLAVLGQSDELQILAGHGDGAFTETAVLQTMAYPLQLRSGDVNLDGITDLLLVGAWPNVRLYAGTGGGKFTGPFDYAAYLGYPLAGDFDGDGDPDVIILGDRYAWTMFNTTTGRLLVTGPGDGPANPPLVRCFQLSGQGGLTAQWDAYSATGCGVNVTTAELDGQPGSELLTGPGPGAVYGPHVRGFTSRGAPLGGVSFLAYGTNRFGVNVSAGDLDGDGFDEILTGAGPGPVFGPHVRGWNWDGQGQVTALQGVSFQAYGTPKWGVNVAAGDIDGDGFDEIVTGPGPGAVYGPHVRAWNVDGGAAAAIPAVSFLAYGTNKFGVNVSAGDVDGDGIDEIVTGAGPGAVFGPHVRGWNYDGVAVAPLPGCSFFAWQTPPLTFGVNVFAGADLNGDGRDDIVAGRGPDPAADTEVRVFAYDGSTVSLWFSLDSYPGLTHGTNVAAGWF